LSDVLKTLTFAYIADDTSLYRVSVDPSTLLNGFISNAPIRGGRLDEKSRLLEEHLEGALRIIGPEEPRPALDRKPQTEMGRTSNNRNPWG
jgi:hypothetical protein